MVGGLLGLLAFVLALTLSFGSARFEERRQGTLAEANAIGTAWLRAEATGHPRGSEIARLLEDYGRLRKDYLQAPKIRRRSRRSTNVPRHCRKRSGGTFPLSCVNAQTKSLSRSWLRSTRRSI